MKLLRDDVCDVFYRHVLNALDRATRETFHPNNKANEGATDEDLPRLFKAIDEQVDALAKRFDIELIDAPTTTIMSGG